MTAINEETLYLEIGTAITENTLGLKPRSNEEITNLGKRWFVASLATIKLHICKDEIKTMLSKHKDTSELVSVLADILVACSFPAHIPLLSVSRLCIIVGIHSICGESK